nr:MAG TPA: hypothetical protein [Caudoviricetes sp.]
MKQGAGASHRLLSPLQQKERCLSSALFAFIFCLTSRSGSADR